MSWKALKTLEYDKIIDQFTEYAASPLRKAPRQSLSPSLDLEGMRTWQVQTTDVVTQIRLKGSVSFSGTRDIGDSLKRLDTDSSLSIFEPLFISSLLTMAVRAKTYGRHDADEDGRGTDESQDDFDSPEPLFAGLELLTPPNNEIKRCILSEDGVADDASPGLSHARHSMKVTADRIHTQLNSILNSSRSYFQDAVITMRDGRYCLPIKPEYKNQASGMAHGQPAMSSALFIESMAVIRLDNEMWELEIQGQKEIEAVLASLSNQVTPYTEELRMDVELLAQLGFIFAKAGLARHYKCSAPMLNDKGCIHIKDGRHPLLNPQFVVPTNVWLGREFNLLIVTGPNTGGKTVSLKTVGLFTLMGQPGLHIPVWEGSELVAFDQVFADIGDEQSIEQSLSTFPAHMTNIMRILGEIGSRSLCLFDELDAGTDPTEGAALAIAIPSFPHNMKCRIMAITHYSELKVFAPNTLGVENVCYEFDVEALQPTYRLLIGIPGESNIFAISQKLGLPEYTTDDAKPYLEAKDESFEDLLTSLESSRLTIEREQAEINTYKDEIASSKTRLTQKEECLDERKDKILKNATEGAQHILREVKETADQTIKQINKLAVSSGMGKELEAEHAEFRDQLKKTDEKLAVKPKGLSQPISPKKLKIGDGVKVLSTNLKNAVSTFPNAKGDPYVQTGILRSLANIHDLELLNEKGMSATLGDGSSISYGGKTIRGKGSGSSQTKMSKSSTVSAEVNLIGMTVDEAAPVMEKYLDGAYLTHLQTVRVAHGRRTGALKNAVHRRLCQLKYVKEFRLGQFSEGDSGVIVATFKQKSVARRNYSIAKEQRILVVDDDANIAGLISLYLMKECYETIIMGDSEGALKVLPEFKPNLVSLDLMLPGIDGYQVCRELRTSSRVPVITLSAKGEIFDKVSGLELGTDDYIIEPFDSKELVARVKAVLRRYQAAPAPAPLSTGQRGEYVKYPDLIVNLTNYSIIYMGHSVEMPPEELELLYFLVISPNQVFTREQPLDHIWGYEYVGDTRTVDVHIKRLCEKIKNHNSWAVTTV